MDDLQQSPNASVRRAPRLGVVGRISSAAAVVVVGFFLLYGLARYPMISGWDEGMYLQFASNLANFGEYATSNGERFDRLLPPGGTGPTLIAPVGLALRLSDGSLLAARLVISVYFVAALAGAYLLLRNIRNEMAALIAIPLVLVAGYQEYDTLWAGRQVLAELPALAFLTFALYAWHKCLRSGKSRWAYTGALLLGLSVITKNQLILPLGAFFVLLAAADWLYYRQMTWLQRIAPLGGLLLAYGAWFVISFLIVEAERRGAYLQMQSALASSSFLHPSLSRIRQSAGFFLRSGQAPLAMVAILYGLYRSRVRTAEGLSRLLLPLLAGVLLFNFLVFSIPWARYLLFPLVFCAMCAAMMVEEILEFAAQRWRIRTPYYGLLALVTVALISGPRLVRNAQRILLTGNDDAAIFAALLDERLPEDAKVLNWEWEVDFYSSHTFTRPSPILFSAKIDRVYNHITRPVLEQPVIPADVSYYIEGPFTRSIALFADAVDQPARTLELEEGPYQLYRLDWE